MADSKNGAHVTAFDRGRKAGSTIDGSVPANPFEPGTAEHNNFEIGRRFGATHSKPSLEALIPDADED